MEKDSKDSRNFVSLSITDLDKFSLCSSDSRLLSLL